MYYWNEVVQKMLDWIEDNITKEVTLLKMAREIGYSPTYCSTQFHKIVGVTMKTYVANRKLSYAAIDLRDTDLKIIEIALKYNFSAQEAFSRAFKNKFNCTPALYRKNKNAMILPMRKTVFFPEHYTPNEEERGEKRMRTILTTPSVRVEYIPAHKFLGVYDERFSAYWDFMMKKDCDAICGFVDSLAHLAHPVVEPHTGAWLYKNGKPGYVYGMGVEENYSGEVPEGFQLFAVPASYYLVFFHPPFDYNRDCEEVMNRVEKLAADFDSKEKGFVYDETNRLIYQRHNPEEIGYEILRPVKKQ